MTTSNGYMGRESFAAASARRFKDVPLPDGQKARIRSITAGEWASLDLKNLDARGQFNLKGYRYSDARLIAFCVVDADGNPIFNEADLDTIMALDMSLVSPLLRAIRDHCRILTTVEDAEKNSSATAAAGSPST